LTFVRKDACRPPPHVGRKLCGGPHGGGTPRDNRNAPSGFGVFATINGKKFKAVSTGEADDPCIGGFYQAGGGVVFTAGECRTARGRRIARRNFKQVVFDCGLINPPAPTPPFETPCLAAGYAEARTKNGIPALMKLWGSSATFEVGPGGTSILHSGVNLRIDSFDGTYVRGAFFGVFDVPLQAGTPTRAAISGEGRFYLPVRGIQP